MNAMIPASPQAASAPGKISCKMRPKVRAIIRPTPITIHPMTAATVPPTFDGRPARVTDVAENGVRG